MQVFELILHLAVPRGLGVDAEIAQSRFHIRSGTGMWLRRTQRVRCGEREQPLRCQGRATSPVPLCPLRQP
jgi:hypothetical protein